MKLWRKEFEKYIGELYAIEGLEAVLEGELVESDGKLMLRYAKDQPAVLLQPLKEKVQLDPKTGKAQPATDSEKEAFERLRARWAKHRGAAPRLLITGPLVASGPGDSTALTLREFTWIEGKRD